MYLCEVRDLLYEVEECFSIAIEFEKHEARYKMFDLRVDLMRLMGMIYQDWD